MDTPFEIQGRFHPVRGGRVSITQAVSIDTGVEGAPDFDVFTEMVDNRCSLNYYVNGVPADFGEDGEAIDGIIYMPNVYTGKETVDYVFFTGSAVMYTVLAKKGNFGCVLNSKVCLPPSMVNEQRIVGLLGSPNGKRSDEWMNPYGVSVGNGGSNQYRNAYDYCTTNWCVHKEEDSIFGYLEGTSWADYYGCDDSYNPALEELISNPSQGCVDCCGSAPLETADYNACLAECMEGGEDDCKIELHTREVLEDVETMCPDIEDRTLEADYEKEEKLREDPAPEPEESIPEPEEEPIPETEKESTTAPEEDSTPEPVEETTPAPLDLDEDGPVKKASGSGDPHFKVCLTQQ